MKQPYKKVIPLLVVFTVLVSSNFIDAAWTAPAGTPSAANNAEPPINESINNQLKIGDITARNLKAGAQMWSPEYCDETGANCFNANDVASSTGGGTIDTWVTFDGTGNDLIKNGNNIASVIRVSAGEWRINFSNPMPDTNYAVFVTIEESTIHSGNPTPNPSVSEKNTDYVIVRNWVEYNATLGDSRDINVMIVGNSGAGGGTGGSLVTGLGAVASGWPDAIRCTSGATTVIVYPDYFPNASGVYFYRSPASGGSGPYLTATFNAAGDSVTSAEVPYGDCNGQSITDLTANGKAIYFSGSGASGGFGVGQAWVDVTSSRACATDYMNVTGKPIQVALRVIGHGGGLSATIDGVVVPIMSGFSGWTNMSGAVVVPDGATYNIQCPSTIYAWAELR